MNDPIYGAPARRRGGGLIAALLIAFLIGIAVTALAVRRWDRVAAALHPLSAPATTATPMMATSPLLLTPAPLALPAPAADLSAALEGRLSVIDSRLAAIEQKAQAASGDADRAEALLVAFAARRALDRGRPLGYLEGMLRDRFAAADAPSVALVIAAAQRPVTLSQLQDGFAALAPDLVSAGANGDGWWQATRRELGSLFVVRRADAPSAVPADRVARATRALEQGQVDNAAAEVARMPGAARAGAWLASARRYLLARGALDRLETLALLTPDPAHVAVLPAAPDGTPAVAPTPLG